jgi:hypothetical protein
MKRMQRTGARLREWWSQPAVRAVLTHREVGSEIAQMAVLTGAVVAVGIGVVLAFMNGMGTFFNTLLVKIQAMVP